MDFADSPEHAAFRREVRRWLDANLPPEICVDDAVDQRVAPDREIFEKRIAMAEDDARRGLGRALLAQGIWRPRRQLYAAGHLRRGIHARPRPGAAGGERASTCSARALIHWGTRGAEAAPPAAHPQRRRIVVPGLLRARRRRRSREPADPRRRPRRPFRRQRPEGVDLGRAFCRLVLSAGAHRSRRAQAPRHQLSAGRHEEPRGSRCGRWSC